MKKNYRWGNKLFLQR